MPRLNDWLSAFRLRTLPLALSGIILGSLLAYSDGLFNAGTLVLALLTATLLQILSNLANDFGDSEHGADNSDRVGPKRAVQTGQISKSQMRTAVIFFSVIAFICGVGLLFQSFWPENKKLVLIFLGIGLAAIAAAIKYTMGKNPYGYKAMGDIFVFIFFGLVAVMGTYFLHSKVINWSILLQSATIGFFFAAVLNLNNMRDVINDKAVGKITIPVLTGIKFSHRYHQLIITLAVLCSILYLYLNSKPLTGYIFLITVPILFLHLQKVKKVEPKALNPELKKIALITLVFSLLLGIGCILGS